MADTTTPQVQPAAKRPDREMDEAGYETASETLSEGETMADEMEVDRPRMDRTARPSQKNAKKNKPTLVEPARVTKRQLRKPEERKATSKALELLERQTQ